jgi:DNA repair photolyase
MIYKKGRGAQINPPNKFLKNSQRDVFYEDLATMSEREELASKSEATQYIRVYPKTILNEVKSPDLPMSWSLNPYQGCEHGCVYCYARNAHEYWDYSSGTDFETHILYKADAHKLLEQRLNSPKWKPVPVLVAGNTDCYQPIERKLCITQKLLKVFLKYKHPVSVITKNSMITRDEDILSELAKDHLVHVHFSLTTLNEELKRKLEPRTASVRNALRTIEALAKRNIPVNVMMAPVIPALNDHEIFDMAKATSDAGARTMKMIVVRLNGNNALLFEDWLEKNYPERKNKVLNGIRSLHDGKLNDSRFGIRQTGEGFLADMIQQQFSIAVKKFFGENKMPELNTQSFVKSVSTQLSLL